MHQHRPRGNGLWWVVIFVTYIHEATYVMHNAIYKLRKQDAFIEQLLLIDLIHY